MTFQPSTPARLALSRALPLLALAVVPAALGATASALPAPPRPARTGSAADAPPASGDVIARFELGAPSSTSFVLHGTVPVPPGTFPAASGQVPFAVLDADGSPVATQVEPVTWYPDLADGADVVEVLARVQRPAGAAPGDRITYAVAVSPQAPPPDPGEVGLEDLTLATAGVPASVKQLLANDANVLVVGDDAFDHLYLAQPLRDREVVRTRYGTATSGVRTYSTMLPTPSVAGPSGTLPHLFGVHAYLSTVAGEEIVLMDLRFNNGPANTDPSSAIDDPIGDAYFESLYVLVPLGWVVVQDVSDPFFDKPSSLGGYTVQPLVKELPGGELHFIPSQGQFHRRLAIARAGKAADAHRLLDRTGQAFCRAGVDAATSHELYSWWNAATARYFPQSHRLPSLSHLGLANLRAQLTSEFLELKDLMETGNAKPGVGSASIYPVKYPVMGWAHPYGVSTGGMTGGSEIDLFEGVREVCAASNEGYRNLQLQHRMQNDRQPFALWTKEGRPARVSDYLVTTGPSAPYFPFVWFNGQFVTGQDVVGLTSTPDFQRQHVAALGLQPPYEADMKSFDPIDYQHYVRYTRSPKFLAWIGNDPLAKDDVRAAAESYHLSYHEFPQQSGAAQANGLMSDQLEVLASPGSGFTYGRGEGWGLDAVNAAFALSDDAAWRSEIRDWSELIVDVLELGQSKKTGIVQSKVSPKQFQGQYRYRQSIEAAIGDNAWMGMKRTIWEGVDAFEVGRIENVLRKSAYGMISSISWWPGEHAPWAHVPLGPAPGTAASQWGSLMQLQLFLPLGCTTPECIAGHTSFHDDFQIGSSLAYAYELTGDAEFLSRALLHTKNPLPGQTLLQKLEADGTKFLGNRAALIALAQELGGP